MTDFFGNLLTQMSSAFNQPPQQTTEDIDIKLNNDKTLKWRGLHNNQFASSRSRPRNSSRTNGNKMLKNDSDGVDEETISEETGGGGNGAPVNSLENRKNAESNDSKAEEEKSQTTIVTTAPEDDGKTPDIETTTEKKSKNLKSRAKNINFTSERVLRRKTISEHVPIVTIPNDVITTGSSDEIERSKTPETQTATATRKRRKMVDDTSPKRRGSRRLNEESVKEIADEKLPTPEPSEVSTAVPIVVKIEKRGRKKKVLSLPPPVTPPPTGTAPPITTTISPPTPKSPTPIPAPKLPSEEKEVIIKQDDSTADKSKRKSPKSKKEKTDEDIVLATPVITTTAVTIQDASPPPKVEPITVTVKKPGRRSRAHKNEDGEDRDDKNFEVKVKIDPPNSPPKKSQRLGREGNNILATAMARKEKSFEQVVPQQRLSRRIKPTAKILANEELRFNFEHQNNVRLSLSSENLEHDEELSPKEKHDKEILEDLQPPPTLQLTSSYPSSTTVSDDGATDSIKFSANLVTGSVEPVINSGRKICPDPTQFLNEIKNQKIALHRSPEDNKKLNKKQLRRLHKLKEKHFAKLGLKKATSSHIGGDESGDGSDTDGDSSDADEFRPKGKINDVGRPGVTLRLRQQRYDERKSKDEPSKYPNASRKRKLNIVTPQKTHPESSLLPSVPSSSNISSASSSSMVNSTLLSPKRLHQSSPALNFLCLCDKKSQYYVRKSPELMHCVAIDQIEGQHVGCSNEIGGDLINLVRPSTRVSYMILCDSHRKRMAVHNCCAGCGIFCSQGMFAMCVQNHLFHRDCATKFIFNTPSNPHNQEKCTGPTLVLKCPHCDLDVLRENFKITLKCGNTSVFLPNNLKRAKMVFQSDHNKSSPAATSSSSLRINNTQIDIEKIIPDSIVAIIQSAEQRLKNTSVFPTFTTKDLFMSIHNNNIKRVAEIVVSGFDITMTFREFQNGTCLHLVACLGNLTIAYLVLCRTVSKYFLDLMDNEMRTAMMCAVAAEKYDVLQLLIKCGADVTARGVNGMTVLHLAAKRGDFTSIQIILESFRQSSSVSKFKRFVDAVDDGHWTALVWAAEHGHSEIVSYLINMGGDANICDNENNTALHWSALSDQIETVLPLLQSNCDFNVQNINGDTPLHISCRQSNTQICLVFLAHGADLNIRNIADETPFDCIPDENSPCSRAIKFNMQLRQMIHYPHFRVLSQDISNGRERYPIQIIADIRGTFHRSGDDEMNLPDFKYITKTILLQNSLQIDQRISQMRICNCSDDCVTDDCQCSVTSFQNWYNSEGRLKDDFNYDDPAMIFECNDVCGCNKLLCKNRVVQNGVHCRLQVIKCQDTVKGWGVQTLAKIKKGTFIAEYTGEILTDSEADRRTDDSYFFDLGSLDHCIDSNFYGNVSRFFNHSCSPNIVPIRVYFEHQDLRFPKIAFFASRDIEAKEEITFDYGEKFWIVKFKNFTCHCNTIECKYSKTTISKTLQDYNQRNPSCN